MTVPMSGDRRHCVRISMKLLLRTTAVIDRLAARYLFLRKDEEEGSWIRGGGVVDIL